MNDPITNEDYLAIRNLVARFDDAVNRRDAAEFAPLWAEAGVWEIGDPRPLHLQGAAQIVSTWQQMIGGTKWLFRGSFEGVLEVRDGVVHGRWPCVETGVFADGTPYDNRAYYSDTYVKEGGAWKFRSRRYVYLWISESPVVGPFFPAE